MQDDPGDGSGYHCQQSVDARRRQRRSAGPADAVTGVRERPRTANELTAEVNPSLLHPQQDIQQVSETGRSGSKREAWHHTHSGPFGVSHSFRSSRLITTVLPQIGSLTHDGKFESVEGVLPLICSSTQPQSSCWGPHQLVPRPRQHSSIGSGVRGERYVSGATSRRMQRSHRAALRLRHPMPLAMDRLSPARRAAVRSPAEGMSSQHRHPTARPAWTAWARMGEALIGRLHSPMQPACHGRAA